MGRGGGNGTTAVTTVPLQKQLDFVFWVRINNETVETFSLHKNKIFVESPKRFYRKFRFPVHTYIFFNICWYLKISNV